MMLINATALDRKSGGAQWRDLRSAALSWKCFSTERSAVEGPAVLSRVLTHPLQAVRNCAAWSFHKPFSQTTISEFDRVVAINQRAPFFLSEEFAKAVSDGIADPCIVNIASVNALVGNANLIAYASTKGALVAMGRAMAVELAPLIRVVTISPGAILTTNTGNLIAEGQIVVQPMLDRCLVKRFITVKEVPPHFAYVSKRVPSYGGPTFVSSFR
jgi:NAD(P)-dependent dehydrogenase (short-subunit alcohol dehydrogenase family)